MKNSCPNCGSPMLLISCPRCREEFWRCQQCGMRSGITVDEIMQRWRLERDDFRAKMMVVLHKAIDDILKEWMENEVDDNIRSMGLVGRENYRLCRPS